MGEFKKVENGAFSVDIDLAVTAVYDATFKGKDGADHSYYRAYIKGPRGLKDVAVTEDLFKELDGHVPATISCTALVNLIYGNVKLTTLQ